MATGPNYQLGYIRDRQTIAILGGIFHDNRYDWDTDGNLIYLGSHEYHNPATSGLDDADYWDIWKLTWTSGNLTRMEGPLRGNWDSRTTLAWG